MAGKKNAFLSQVKQLGVLTTIPIILLVGPIIGFYIGGWIDGKFHVYPWFTIIFIVLGFVASAKQIIYLLKEVLREDKSQNTNKDKS